MAEAALFSVAGRIVVKLASPLFQQIGLWWSVEDELEKLGRMVASIQLVLLDAEDKYSESDQIRDWLLILKDAIYDADDLLDDFSTEALRQQVMSGSKFAKEVRLFFSSSNKLAYGLIMAHKIKSIRRRLYEIASIRKFHLVDRPVEILSDNVINMANNKEREQSHSSLPDVVVGRENEKMEIVRLLFNPNYEENVAVVPIVGLGGLGKTTLAQLVFGDEAVKLGFDLFLWVYVSHNFKVKLIVEKIIEEVTGEKPSNLQMNTLKNLLHEKINGKKYLLVLDDLWNDDAEKWFQLKDLLMGGGRGSRIIVTTRSEKVAEITRPVALYVLQGLSEDESWDLFSQMAFKRGQLPSPSHQAIGKEIAAKCAGVPLAIKTIGRLLYLEENEFEWLSFKNKELSKVDQKEGDILPTLKLSYNRLPSHLKHCFAFCSLFPRGFEIDVDKLTTLWVVQGYVKSSDQSQSLVRVARGYFMDLLWMSFFQESRKNAMGDIETCTMHDLMHELATSVAGAESIISNSDERNIHRHTRHISFNLDLGVSWQLPPALLRARKLRTFLLADESGCKIGEEQCHLIFSNLRCLRVLDLHDSGMVKIPKSITKLNHLRYLDLSDNKGIELLPDSITRLQNLQVLKLDMCTRLKELPNGMMNMINLMRLYLYQCVALTHMPCGLGQLTSLQVLSRFVVVKDSSLCKHSGGLGELRDMNNLAGGLYIGNLAYVKNPVSEFEAANLKEKQYLKYLKLAWKEDDDDNDSNDLDIDEVSWDALRPHLNLKGLVVKRYGGLNFPRWIPSLTNLAFIGIHNCRNCRFLPALDKFPFLKELQFSGLFNLEYIVSAEKCGYKEGSSPFFPSLELLMISDCPNLKGWWKIPPLVFELPRFQCLSSLHIKSCPKLASLPLFPPLKVVVFEDASMNSLEEILKMANMTSQSNLPSSSTTNVVPQLKSLRIAKIKELEFLPEGLLLNLSSLVELYIFDCPRIKTMAQAVELLTSLKHIHLRHCEELDFCSDINGDGKELQGFKNLRSFIVEDLPKLTSLPKELQHVTSLTSLGIVGCANLMSLPEWMGNIRGLRYLFIDRCPPLSQRCGHKKAVDWSLIAHIPYITIDGKKIQ